MTRDEILSNINNLLNERLFSKIKDQIIKNKREHYTKSLEYNNMTQELKRDNLNENYSLWYKEIDKFYLQLHSIFALSFLVKNEKNIQQFSSENITFIKAKYIYSDVEFEAVYPTKFTEEFQKEIEDVLEDLKNPNFKHIVSSYKEVKDKEKSPPKPFTNATLKYSSLYLLGYKNNYTSQIATMLFEAGLITDINTNGYYIDDDVVDEIITLLNSKYNEEQVLTYKREYIDRLIDRSQDCIRPVFFTNEYYPKNIINTPEFSNIMFETEQDREAAFRIYEMIFLFTISTQMKDSIYDASSVVITCGSKTLKQTAHVLLEGQENWELISGKLVAKLLEKTESSENKATIILPEFQDDITELDPIIIYPYNYNSRRPKRFGIGRFIVQVLEKYNIGLSTDYDKIISNLVESKSCTETSNILYPQENSIFLINWLEQYIPLFLDLHFLNEIEEKIYQVTNNELTINHITNEINNIIDNALMEAKIDNEDMVPSEKKQDLVRKLALKNNISIDDSILKSTARCDIFLSKYSIEEEIVKIGNCPNCSSKVLKKSYLDNNGDTMYYFACEGYSKKCSFSVSDNYLYKFFSNKGLELYNVDERIDILAKILKRKKGYLFTGLINRNNKIYNAKIYIEKYLDDSKKERWKFGFNFVNDEKSIKNAKFKIEVNKQKTTLTDTVSVLHNTIKELKNKNRRLEDDTSKDHLTRLFNRKTLEDNLNSFWKHNQGEFITLAFIDGDKFKDVNDTYGHQAGDEVLKYFSNTFMNYIRNYKIRAYRYGGEEFVIVSKESKELTLSLMEKIRVHICNNPVIFEKHTIKLSVSIGVALAQKNIHWELLLKKADELVYRAKENGRNRIEQ